MRQGAQGWCTKMTLSIKICRHWGYYKNVSSDSGINDSLAPFHSTGTYWALAALQEVAEMKMELEMIAEVEMEVGDTKLPPSRVAHRLI